MPRIQWIGLALLSFSLTGCVAQEKYNAMKMDRDRKDAQLQQAQKDASDANAKAAAFEQQLAALNGNANSQTGLVSNLTSHNADLERQLAELNQRYMDAIRDRGQGTALPPVLSNELKQFADANPDLVEFDAAHGIVKFKSDVTFDKGSADLTDKAKSAIDRFAQILKSPSAGNYELIVAGHTDNTPVSNPATIQKGHKNNWYLSAHRAISVSDELQRSGVAGKRMGVTGYADNRPVASNASPSGQAQNRRVEVLILPTTASGPALSSTPAKPTAAPKAAARQPMNKDAVVTPQKPAMNK